MQDMSKDELILEIKKLMDRIGELERTTLENRNTGEALKQSEEKFRTVFESSAVGITVGNDKEQLISWNKFTEKLLEMTEKDLYLKPLKSFYTPEEWARIRSMNIRQKGMQEHLETRMIKADGESVEVDISISVLKDAQGRVTGSIGIIRDITQRKKAEHALRESEEKFRTVFENSAVAITVVNDKEQLVSWNNFTEKLLGMKHEDLYLAPLHSLYPPDEWARIRSMNIREKGMQEHLETKMIKANGELIDIDVSISVLKDAGGRITGSIGVTRDITERKRAEEAQKVKETVLAMAKARSQFLANMSHEIRTPINGITGMLELLLDTGVTAEQKEFLRTAKTSADSLLTLINDILDFSKIEAGKFTLEPIDFNLRDSLGDTISTLAPRAHLKGLVLACHILPDVPEHVVGDPGRLRQVIVNLIGNSIKFTEKGEIILKVEREKTEGDGLRLHFMVIDTGIGVPRERQKIIFDPFTQADNSTTRRYGGTGLGLSISAQIVKLMEGKIYVESPSAYISEVQGGPGSVFHFTGEFQPSRRAAERERLMTQIDLKDLNVLIVDPHETNRNILQEMIASWQMKPVMAMNARAAVSLLNQARASLTYFPFVLLDINMPDIDGFSLCEWIRKTHEFKKSQVIMMTSAGIRGDGARCKQVGAAGYLTKPIKQSVLLDMIVTLLASQQSQGQAAAPEVVTVHSLREQQRPLKILLVEDNFVNQQVAMRLLAKKGHHVTVADNGRKAIEVMDKETFDLVLMDVQMPEMDGFEATGAIRSRERQNGGHIPIVAMTAHTMQGDRERCLKAGMDGYVSKPVRPEELFEVIYQMSHGDVGKAAVADVVPINGRGGASDVPTEGPAIMDLSEALSHVGGDEELRQQILQVYFEDAPIQLEKIETAIREGNSKNVEIHVHGLKGASANVGAMAIRQAAWDLELAAKELRIQDYSGMMEKIRAEFQRLKTHLGIGFQRGDDHGQRQSIAG